MSPTPLDPPIVLLAGDTAVEVSGSPAGLAVRAAFTGRTATLVSGGTDAGVAALAAEIGLGEPGVRTVGYVPDGQRALADGRYDEVRFTVGDDFSLLEPLEAWADIETSGIAPGAVAVLGIGGGPISALEYRLALLLGARVGLVTGTGRAVDDLLADERCRDHPRLVALDPDGVAIGGFLAG